MKLIALLVLVCYSVVECIPQFPQLPQGESQQSYAPINYEMLSRLEVPLIRWTNFGYKNAVVSSMFMRPPLCKMASAATGQVKKELMTLLGFHDDSLLSTCYTRAIQPMFDSVTQTGDMMWTTRIYVNNSEEIDPKFFNQSFAQYGVQILSLQLSNPYASQDFINRQIGYETYWKVQGITSKMDFEPPPSLLVANGVYFRGNWETRFNLGRTQMLPFRLINKTMINMPMMSHTGEYMHYEDNINHFQVITKYLSTYAFSISFYIPTEFKQMQELLQRLLLRPQIARDALRKVTFKRIKLVMPRIKIKSCTDWANVFRQGPLNQTLKRTLDFSGMTRTKANATRHKFSLNRIKQKIFFEVNEAGGAAQSEESREAADLEVRLERPFFFQVNIGIKDMVQPMLTGIFLGID